MIDMQGHIDGTFKSVPATRAVTGGSRVNGIWVETKGAPEPYDVNIQPASDREIDFLARGGERITDVRRVYVNEGNMEAITNNGEWNFLGQRWKTVKCDNRYWHNYCKLIVVRIDDQ
jgi:hypothetical protein